MTSEVRTVFSAEYFTVQTILECLNLLNNEITSQKITTPETLSVFIKLMEIELGIKKEIPQMFEEITLRRVSGGYCMS